MRLHRWILVVASRLVPKDTRAEWRAEWHAELHHREARFAKISTGRRRGDHSLARVASGALWDAVWLQTNRWYSLRLFGRHWRLAAAAVGSLSIALAAVVMGLSAYNALLVRPPGVQTPQSLRFIHLQTVDEPYGSLSYPEFTEFRQLSRAFTDIAAFPYAVTSGPLTADRESFQVVSTDVSWNFFSVLGIRARLGRLTTDSTDTEPAIVIGERLWRRLGGTDTDATIGRIVAFEDTKVRIAGVVPSSFHGMTWGFDPDVWALVTPGVATERHPTAEFENRTERSLHLVGRLRPDVTAGQAAADVRVVAAAIAREHPETNAGHTAALTPVTVTPPGDRAWASTVLGALMLIVLLTLAAACGNVVNLLLGLAASRRHEMLVRAALGASRRQLAAPLVREGVILGLTSGGLGYALAWIALDKLSKFKPALGAFFPSLSLDVRPDTIVMAATLAIAFVSGVLVGLVPALRSAADGLAGALNSERGTGAPGRARLRHVLLVLQMTVATLVLVGVGLSVHSLLNLRRAPLGFSARNLVYATIDANRTAYDAAARPAFYDRLRERLLATPGIDAVTIASDGPLTGYQTDRVIAGDEIVSDGHGAETPFAVVDTAYFSAVGVPVLEGRAFDSRDRQGGADVIVINHTFAGRHWPGRDPIGRRVRIENGARVVEVIGVVADGTYGDIGEDQLPFMYLALAQHPLAGITLIARTNQPVEPVARALQSADAALERSGVGILTLQDLLGMSLTLPRAIVWGTIGFGALAFGLATLGLYSTVFYGVEQRRAEMEIRSALGATGCDLFALVFKDSGRVALSGAAVGLGVGLFLLPLARSIFYGIGSVEPIVLAAVSSGSVLVTLLMTYFVVRPWVRHEGVRAVFHNLRG